MERLEGPDDILEVCDNMNTIPTSYDIIERAKKDKKTLAWVLSEMKTSLLVHFEKRSPSASHAIRFFWQRLPIERHLDRINDQHLSRLCLLALDIGRYLRDRIYFRAEWKQIMEEHTDPLRFCVEALKRECTTDFQAEPMTALS